MLNLALLSLHSGIPMSITPNLGLPYLEAGQAQKHVTHNEALRALDTLVQLAVLDRDLAAPPASPAEGQRWIVKAGATDAWAGRDNRIAAWQDGAWQFRAPAVGWVAYVVDEEILVAWDGASWSEVSGGAGGGGDPAELQNMTLLGVGTTADAANPFSAKLNSALWAAKTVAEGGDGNLRYQLSKESAAKTLSLLLQNNFSDRAEIGLTGDDDFHFKVSPDGTSWLEALKIERATGKVSFPVSGGPRETLTANRTYYVRTDGSDSNNGLSNTAGGAFLTIQKALNVCAALDLGTFNVTIQVADGTYTGANRVTGPWLGSGNVTVLGNTAAPGNVVINVTGGACFWVENGGRLTVSGMELRTTTSGECVRATRNGYVSLGAALRFGTCVGTHIYSDSGGYIEGFSSYSIVGSATNWHIYAASGRVGLYPSSVTLTGTPNFGLSYIHSEFLALVDHRGMTFTGSATGKRYTVQYGGVINSGGAGTNFYPGNVTGTGVNPSVSPYGLYI
jgi:hypothetical protein